MQHRALSVLIGVACCFAAAGGVRSDKKTFLVQDPSVEGNKVLVVVSHSQSDDGRAYATTCRIVEGKGPVEKFLKMTTDSVEMRPNPEELREIKEDCYAFSLLRRKRSARNEGGDDEDSGYDYEDDEPTTETPGQGNLGISIIFPGTKWCGSGDVARKFDDLGFHQDTDRCCRAHDLCNDTMGGGETKNNLTNNSKFTALSCQCDDEFYDCLDRVNTLTSNTVGNSYFNVLKRRCYALDYPQTKKCNKYRTFLKLRCAEYEKDKTAPKVYQWIPARWYKKLPVPGPLTVSIE